MTTPTSRDKALGELRGLAHELNNVLGVIRNHAELLRDALPPGQQRDDLEEIEAAVTKAAAIAERLRTIARGEIA